jgi:hypothetical protein
MSIEKKAGWSQNLSGCGGRKNPCPSWEHKEIGPVNLVLTHPVIAILRNFRIKLLNRAPHFRSFHVPEEIFSPPNSALLTAEKIKYLKEASP